MLSIRLPGGFSGFSAGPRSAMPIPKSVATCSAERSLRSWRNPRGYVTGWCTNMRRSIAELSLGRSAKPARSFLLRNLPFLLGVRRV